MPFVKVISPIGLSSSMVIILFAAQAAYVVGVGPMTSVTVDVSTIMVVEDVNEVLVNDEVTWKVKVVEASTRRLVMVV
jgi:hypothetical protein